MNYSLNILKLFFVRCHTVWCENGVYSRYQQVAIPMLTIQIKKRILYAYKYTTTMNVC